MPVINFTQHTCTPDQIEAGIIEFPAEHKHKLCTLLTFEELPNQEEVWNRAVQLVQLFETVAVDLDYTYDSKESSLYPMIGGAPFLMTYLEDAFDDAGITVYYAFSKRESIDVVQPDGSVKKVATFRHVGLYQVG